MLLYLRCGASGGIRTRDQQLSRREYKAAAPTELSYRGLQSTETRYLFKFLARASLCSQKNSLSLQEGGAEAGLFGY